MFRPFVSIIMLFAFIGLSGLCAETALNTPVEAKVNNSKPGPSFKPFTGKVLGSHVRMRIAPDLDSHIATALSKDDYVVVTAEHGDFYAVEPPADLRAYIFRGFIIDQVVEGDRVNVRLSPDREAPVIGHYSTGTHIEGQVCVENNKWLEIKAPPETRFYIAKEYIEYAGNPEMKLVHDKRKEAAKKLLDATHLLTQTETRKPFYEIDADRIVHQFRTIINDYADFTSYVEQATKSLAEFQEDYLHRKIAFLEAKTSKLGIEQTSDKTAEAFNAPQEAISATDRMKIWEPVEQALYLSWSTMHHAKKMDDFYQDQKLKAQTVSGILEAYREPVKHKPGDFILKEHDLPTAYIYSTHVNLEDYVGKQVTLVVSPRENNNFAFPAFYVLDVK